MEEMNKMMAGFGMAQSKTAFNPMMTLMSEKVFGKSAMGSLESISSMASNPFNALLMKKYGKEDASSCFAKIDMAATETHECMPDSGLGECGTANDPSSTTTQPWNVIFSNADGNLHCGGVLICSSWILTTASCMKDLEKKDVDLASSISAFIDVTDAANVSSAQQVDVRRIVYHELYQKEAFGRRRLIHDIAAVQIYSVTNTPICLPKITENIPEDGSDLFSQFLSPPFFYTKKIIHLLHKNPQWVQSETIRFNLFIT